STVASFLEAAPPPDTSPLSLHDALPIYLEGVTAVAMTASGTKRMPPDTTQAVDHEGAAALARAAERAGADHLVYLSARGTGPDRSEEHTSELQSRENLVCRLLLEKKKSH